MLSKSSVQEFRENTKAKNKTIFRNIIFLSKGLQIKRNGVSD
jgi:hypothetical protein